MPWPCRPRRPLPDRTLATHHVASSGRSSWRSPMRCGAYLGWGMMSLYFRQTSFMSAPEVLDHRILWSLVLTALGTFFLVPRADVSRRCSAIAASWRAWPISSLFLATNWLIFIWAVADGQALEAGLGYFICPLLSVVLGACLFKERMSRVQFAGLVIVCDRRRHSPPSPSGACLDCAVAGRHLCDLWPLPEDAQAAGHAGALCRDDLLVPLRWRMPCGWREAGRAFPRSDVAWPVGLIIGLRIHHHSPAAVLCRCGQPPRPRPRWGLMQYLNPTVQVSLAVLVYGEPFTQFTRHHFRGNLAGSRGILAGAFGAAAAK